MSATRTMVREDMAIIYNDDSMVSSFGFEKNLSTITAWVLILLLSYDKSTILDLRNDDMKISPHQRTGKNGVS